MQELVQQRSTKIVLGFDMLRNEVGIHQQQRRIIAQGDGQRRYLSGEDEPGDRQDTLTG